MTRHTVVCPICGMHFFPDAAHRFSGTCSAICARQQTTGTRFTTHTMHLDQTIIAPRPSISRKHGEDRKGQTE